MTGAHFIVVMVTFPGGLSRARAILAERFGHGGFRPAQLRVVGPLLAGRDVLAVLPTGAGKSLCSQLPALMADGLTLVVSPLISLMQDQVAALRRRGIAAAYLNSLLTPDHRRVILDATLAGRLRLLYCAPEQLRALVARLCAAGRQVSLLAVGEAHCITEWGNEFRPVYRRLGQFRYLLGDPTTLALTGSATPATRGDILRVLRTPGAEVVVASFDRPNLRFTVVRVRDDRDRFARIRALVRCAAGHTIVYAPTRRLTELVTRALWRRSLPAAPYHAGLSAAMRRHALLDFLGNRAPVVVATSAFGMGIDKPDVRCVIHWGPPRTLEGYYQEAGRAGPDGGPADCLVLWTRADAERGAVAPEVRRYVESHACGVACYSLTSGKRASCARGATDATSRERLGKRPVNCRGRGRVPSPASHRPLTGLSPDRGVPLPDRVVAGPAQGVQNGGAGGTSARAAGSRFVFFPPSEGAAMPRISRRNLLFVPRPPNRPPRIPRPMHRAMG